MGLESSLTRPYRLDLKKDNLSVRSNISEKSLIILPVLFAVGSLRGLQSAGGVTLEVLPQPGARGEPLTAGLALVRLVSRVDPLVVGQVPLRLKTTNLVTISATWRVVSYSERLPAVPALEGSLSRVFPHVNLQVVLLHKALAAVLTEVGLGVGDAHVTVEFV